MTSQAPQPGVIQATYVTQNYVPNDVSAEGITKYAKIFYNLGITQITLSILSVGLGIALVAYGSSFRGGNCYYWTCFDPYANSGTGIWCGVFFFISGMLGLFTGKNKTRPLTIAGLVMAMISTVFAATQLGFEISGSLYAVYYIGSPHYRQALCGLHAVLAVAGFVEFVISICHWAYGFHVLCCYKSETIAPAGTTYAYVNPPQVYQVPAGSQQSAYIQTTSQQVAANPQFVQQPTLFTTTLPQEETTVQGQPTLLAQQPPPYLVQQAQAQHAQVQALQQQQKQQVGLPGKV